MCCEHLVCANCAHLVADAHCPVCRAARDRMHRHSPMQPTAVLVVLAALLALAVLVSAHLGG